MKFNIGNEYCMDRVQEDSKLLNIRNAEECEKDREGWRQYDVAAIGLKCL